MIKLTEQFDPCLNLVYLKIQMDECNCKYKNAKPKIESRFYSKHAAY